MHVVWRIACATNMHLHASPEGHASGTLSGSESPLTCAVPTQSLVGESLPPDGESLLPLGASKPGRSTSPPLVRRVVPLPVGRVGVMRLTSGGSALFSGRSVEVPCVRGRSAAGGAPVSPGQRGANAGPRSP